MQPVTLSAVKLPLSLALVACLGACDERAFVVGDVRADTAMHSPFDAADLPAASEAGVTRPDFLLGADISWVQEQEAAGLVFVDAGQEQDILDILKAHGFNAIRLRLFLNPASACRPSVDSDETCGYQFELAQRSQPFCDLEHTLAMAARVKAAGMQLLLDFHFSDTWADPNDQNKPLAWEQLDFEELKSALHDYTRDTLLAFEAAGISPTIVQLGNGITPGILLPDGSNKDWTSLASLLRSAISATRETAPAAQILLHIDKPDSFTTSDWWVGSALENGVEFDILGQSCFTQSQGPVESWRDSFERLADKYDWLRFMVVEYSDERRAINDLMVALPGERGLGSFVWEPTEWGETLFDREGDRLVTNHLIQLYDAMSRDYGTQILPR